MPKTAKSEPLRPLHLGELNIGSIDTMKTKALAIMSRLMKKFLRSKKVSYY